MPSDLSFHRFLFLNATGILLLLGVFIKFAGYAKIPEKRRRRHPVATLTMTAVLVAMLPLLVHQIGTVKVPEIEELCFFGLGSLLMFFAVGLHLAAKWNIGSHWSDQIEAAEGQAFVSRGVYSLTRHPMYSSLILWMFGASLLYVNPLVAGLLVTVFIPMMVARAKAEEKLLEESVADAAGYDIYRQRVNLLIPRFGGPPAFVLRILGIIVYGLSIWNCIGSNFTPAGIVFLAVLHLLIGFTILPEKAAFSYKSKTGMMVVVWIAAFFLPPIYHLQWFFLAMYVYGLFFNCPCMFVYEKYHGCPCFDFLKRSCRIRT